MLATREKVREKKNYNSKREDLEEEDQGKDERNVERINLGLTLWLTTV